MTGYIGKSRKLSWFRRSARFVVEWASIMFALMIATAVATVAVLMAIAVPVAFIGIAVLVWKWALA